MVKVKGMKVLFLFIFAALFFYIGFKVSGFNEVDTSHYVDVKDDRVTDSLLLLIQEKDSLLNYYIVAQDSILAKSKEKIVEIKYIRDEKISFIDNLSDSSQVQLLSRNLSKANGH